MRQLLHLINKINIGYSNRSNSISVPLNNGNLKILHYFFKRYWIRHYLLKDNVIIVYLRFTSNKPLFYNIKVVSTKGCRKYASRESLQSYKYLISRSCLVLLSTSKGFLTMKEAEDLQIGGEILFLFFN